MNRVWERLYLGDWDDAEKLAKSNPNHITTVVTVCEDAVISRARRVNYLHFAIADSRAIPVAKLDAILDAIGENIRWGKVLINCGAGMSRAPIVTAAWMDACGYKNVEAALEELAEPEALESYALVQPAVYVVSRLCDESQTSERISQRRGEPCLNSLATSLHASLPVSLPR